MRRVGREPRVWVAGLALVEALLFALRPAFDPVLWAAVVGLVTALLAASGIEVVADRVAAGVARALGGGLADE